MLGVGALGTVITAIVTPFAEDGAVDEEAFVALLHHLAEHGSDGVRRLRHHRRGGDARPTTSTCA